MAVAIHIELDALRLLILGVIAYQSVNNVNQQMNRVLFRYTVYGTMAALALDILWLLIDGRLFPGAILINQLVNALFLGSGVILGGIWYLYVLETLGYVITRTVKALVLTPGAVMTVLNLISIKTGWIFRITSENLYERGPLFWLQTIAALGMLFASLVHIVIWLLLGRGKASSRTVRKLLAFISSLWSAPWPLCPSRACQAPGPARRSPSC